MENTEISPLNDVFCRKFLVYPWTMITIINQRKITCKEEFCGILRKVCSKFMSKTGRKDYLKTP